MILSPIQQSTAAYPEFQHPAIKKLKAKHVPDPLLNQKSWWFEVWMKLDMKLQVGMICPLLQEGAGRETAC